MTGSKGATRQSGSGLGARVRLWDGGVRKWTVRRGGEQASNVRYMMSTMPKRQRNASDLPLEDALFAARARKKVPHEFVLEALAPLSPRTNPMFGCLAVYAGEKIVVILRDKGEKTADNGVWLATTEEHHGSLRREFPSMRSIGVLGKKVTGWQVLPAEAADFEEAALHACELILAGDPRIGKVPGARRKARPPRSKSAAKRRKRP